MSGSTVKKTGKKKKDGREWLLLLLSVLLAFIIWMLHNLSQDYSVFLEYNVRTTLTEVGKVQKTLSNDVLMIRGKAEGYYILKQRIGKRPVLDIDISKDKLVLKDSVTNLYQVDCENIRGSIVEALGSEVELEFIVTSTLDFKIKKMISKRVPVAAKSAISYNSQYMPVDEIVLQPDSIDIYGEEKLLGTISSVCTKTISFSGVKSQLQGIVDLVPIRWVSFSQDAVYYTQDVARYIEESLTVPVIATGVPEGKSMVVLPSTVDITYRRYFSAKQIDEDDFVLAVRYEDMMESLDSKLVPELIQKPEDVISYSLSPRFVNCVFIDDL